MKKSRKFIPFRRKISGRTNYKKRLKLLISGAPRLIVRKTNKHILIQIAKYKDDGDNVIVTATSAELKKLGWKFGTGNLPAAYLTGMIAAKKSLAKKVDNAIVDLGLQTSSAGTRLFAAIKGCIDAGLKVPCSKDAFPSDERIKGAHIRDFEKMNAKDIEKIFEEVKSKILK
jgi:large subunit ribosomal protein L18